MILLLTFVYFFYVMALVITLTYKRFRYEFYKHRTFMFVFSLGIFICLPLVCLEVKNWYVSYSNYLATRYVHYIGFIARTLPSLLSVLLKPNEDCLNCFNRIAP